MPPTIPELASIGAAHAPQISPTLDAQLELDGFETATIADLPTRQAQIDMGMVQREPLDSCEEDWEIERRPLERHEQLKSCALEIAPCSASSAPDEI